MDSSPLSPLPTLDYFRRVRCVDAGHASVGATVADPGVDMIIPVTFGDVASGDTDFTVSEPLEVLDVWALKRNGAGAANTVNLKKAAATITGDMTVAVDNAVTRATSIDDAASTFARGDTLRFTRVRAAGTYNMQVFLRVRLLV
jgi:hypothetical protein